MNRNDYLADQDVKEFVEWLVSGSLAEPFSSAGAGEGGSPLANLRINLAIPHSRYVPGGRNVELTGVEQALDAYVWKAADMERGDWTETRNRVADLANALSAAIDNGSEERALAACRDILAWGGNRNWARGAWPFLQQLRNDGGLCDYIRQCTTALRLHEADTDELPRTIRMMNAMLTKVHAFKATDGLPIYDSRVAAASAALVEIWRVSTGRSGVEGRADAPLPATLSFPATDPARTLNKLFPNAIRPGLLRAHQQNDAAAWACAKMRLSWVLWAVLQRSPDLFKGAVTDSPAAMPMSQRMRAFEAALFMIGYDIGCLRPAGGAAAEGNPQPQRRRAGAVVWPPARDDGVCEVMPLSGRGTMVQYSREVEGGFSVVWGTTRFEMHDLSKMVQYFSGRQGVPLGARMDGDRLEGTIGQWLADHGYASRRFASPVAAILVNEGLANSYRTGNGIFLNFPQASVDL